MSKTPAYEAHGVKSGSTAYQVFKYIVCILLLVVCLLPFVVMIVNSTRSTTQIQQQSISLLPSHYLANNLKVFEGKDFNAWTGFLNSVIISTGATLCTVYFSTLTAYSIVAYDWKFRRPFFTFILAVMMIPAQLSAIGFYKFMYKIGMTNNLLALILPAIAAPATVFFMKQYMAANLSMEIVAAARVDGCGEFHTFNSIVLPIMKPAMATQGIFAFVTAWNNLFMPSILLTNKAKWTMPIMVSQLRGDIYRTEYGAVYLGLTLTVLPLFIVYFMLSKYIIAGVSLGGVKG